MKNPAKTRYFKIGLQVLNITLAASLLYFKIVALPLLIPLALISSFTISWMFTKPQTAKAIPKRGRVQPRYNDLNERLQDLVNQQQHTIETVYRVHPKTCHLPAFHYDWWLFPLTAHQGASETSKKYSVDSKDIYQLIQDQQFIQNYEFCVDRYLSNLEQYGWNHYEIRFEKMMRSVMQFIEVCNAHPQERTLCDLKRKLKPLAERALEFANAHHINKERMPEVIRLLENALKKTPKKSQETIKKPKRKHR